MTVTNVNNQNINIQTRGTGPNTPLRQIMLKRFTERSIAADKTKNTQQGQPVSLTQAQRGTTDGMRQGGGENVVNDPIRYIPEMDIPKKFIPIQIPENIGIPENPPAIETPGGVFDRFRCDPSADPLAQVRDKISAVEAQRLEQMINNGKTFSSVEKLAAGLGRVGINVSNEMAESIFATSQLDASEEGITLDEASAQDGDVSMEAVLSLISSDGLPGAPFVLSDTPSPTNTPPSKIAANLMNQIVEAFTSQDPSTAPEEILSRFTPFLEKYGSSTDQLANGMPAHPVFGDFYHGPALGGNLVRDVTAAFARDMWSLTEALLADMPQRAAAISVWLTENGVQDPTNAQLTVNPIATPLNTFRANYTAGMDAQAVIAGLKEAGFMLPDPSAGPEAAALANQVEWVLGPGNVSFERVSMLMSAGILNLPTQRMRFESGESLGLPLQKDRQIMVDMQKAVALALNGGTWHFGTEFADVLSNDAEFVPGSDNHYVEIPKEMALEIQKNSNAVGMPISISSGAIDFLMNQNLRLPGDENNIELKVLRLSPALVSHAFETQPWLFSAKVMDGQLNLGLRS